MKIDSFHFIIKHVGLKKGTNKQLFVLEHNEWRTLAQLFDFIDIKFYKIMTIGAFCDHDNNLSHFHSIHGLNLDRYSKMAFSCNDYKYKLYRAIQ